MNIETNKILNGDALSKLKELPSESVNCIMTSPPYWVLRDYGINGQLGLEPTFQEYINKLCDIFDEAKRVLKNDGTCWVNLGDTYGGSENSSGHTEETTNCGKITKDYGASKGNQKATKGMEKSLCNIPARFSIEMQNRGWILRNVIIWHKPNCMPCSVKDRFTIDFEYLFFFVKSKKYWFETQYERLAESSFNDKRKDKGLVPHKSGKSFDNHLIENYKVEKPLLKQDLTGNPTYTGFNQRYAISGTCINSLGRNKRAVWMITTKPFKEAHFATYPEELCEVPIKAGCPEFICNKCGKAREKILESKGTGIDYSNKGNYKREIPTDNPSTKFNRNASHLTSAEYEFKGYSDCGCNAGFSGGICLDPFFGAGTTGLVALKQNKKFIGIELNPEYIKIAESRLKPLLEQNKL
jgi:DNA modification methylase